MSHVNEREINRVTEALVQIIEGKLPSHLDFTETELHAEVAQLAHAVNRIISEYGSFAAFLFDISRGELDVEAPKGKMHMLQSLKNLQANLRHLTWKTQQIARGNLSQQMDFMGEFSKNFNSMVEQLNAAREELLRKNEELDKISRTDPLTDLINRRGALEILTKESYRANRSQRSFLTILADIDHFKEVNDTYGHDAGDAVLVTVAKSLMSHVRCEDLCSRWGGEEFLILLTEANLPSAFTASERLRLGVEITRTLYNGVSLKTTISAGMSVYREGEDIEACIKRSDMCLYKAKESGRNQVWFQESQDTPARPVTIPLPHAPHEDR